MKNMNTITNEFTPLKDFPKYEINTIGEIKIKKTQKFIKARINKDGYLMVVLRINNKVYNKLVHRLVAETFIPNPDKLPIVNHINENKLDNSLDNLEWVTYEQNANHGTRNKKISQKVSHMVIINGILYSSCSQAAKSIGCLPRKIQQAVKEKRQMKSMPQYTINYERM